MDNYQFKIVTNDLEHIDQYLNDFARIHQSAYSNNHFTSLFSSNKLKQYYKSLIQCSDLSLIIYADDKALGFIVSGINVSRGVNVFKRLNRLYLAMLLVSNPKFLIEKISSIVSAAFSKSHVNTTKFRLLSIAVDNSIQSKGIGNGLLSQFEVLLKERGVESYGLSVRIENPRAIKFYMSKGFEIEMEKGETLYLRKIINIV
jgi:ribosomal protein S18 acetylase RimI-like enzyme